MKLIVCADRDWGIGKDNELLLRIPADMKFFRETTTGNAILMGRKTLDSLPGGKPLPKRENLVLTGNPAFVREGVKILHSVEEALAAVKEIEDTGKTVYLIGGGSVYKTFLPFCDTAFVTRLDKTFPADTFFPDLDEAPDWELTAKGPLQTYEGVQFQITEYKKRGV